MAFHGNKRKFAKAFLYSTTHRKKVYLVKQIAFMSAEREECVTVYETYRHKDIVHEALL